jgi:hypothetical protein
MNIDRFIGLCGLAAVALSLPACQTDSKRQIMLMDKSAVELRAMETRAFDTADKALALRNVISTLQDLGFIVDKVDDALGTVSGTKLSGYAMHMTVTIRPHGEKQIAIRASAEYNLTAVSDPKPYQQFFAALEKAMFLTANQID